MILISSHFKVSEFDCHDGTPYPSDWVSERLQPLANMLEKIRERAGHPIRIVCGYRSPSYNDRLRQRGLAGERQATGVAKNSRHCEGDAADISCYGMTTEALHEMILDMVHEGLIPECGGIGYYPKNGWVHVDLYKSVPGKLRRWNG